VTMTQPPAAANGARLPSHDMPAEQAVLGAMMLSADALAQCLDMLTQRAFLRPAHQMVFSALQAIAERGDPADALTVKAELERRGEISKAGGAPYLHTLLAAVPVASNGPHYARKLLDHQARRDAEILASRVLQISCAEDMSPAERFDAIYAAADEASGVMAESGGSVTVADAIGPLLASLERRDEIPAGLPAGWTDLDRLIPGFRSGQLVVVGARPGGGKSVVLLNIAAHAALRLERHVLAVTLEMSGDEYMERLLSAEAGVDLGHIVERKLTDDDWDRIARTSPLLYEAGTLHLHEGPELSVQGIRAELRAMRRAGTPASLVTVDYLQLMGASKSESRQVEVSQMSRGLKLLAREFEVPVIVAAALNRGPEMRHDHRPLSADLRESGSLEQDADVVILLYRDDAYDSESPRAGEIDLIVDKNRQGRKGTATLAFRGHVASCSDMARGDSWTPSAALGAA
jgi:replicative DNA helicase